MTDSGDTPDPDVGFGDPPAVPGVFREAGRGHDDDSVGGEESGEAWLAGSAWRIGGPGEIGWIAAGTRAGLSVTSAIPPIFEAYATVIVPADDEHKRFSDEGLLALLRAQSGDQPWRLGYLETGASKVVFEDAPRVRLYSGWPYVLVAAGPDEAAGWRTNEGALPWHSALPELMFPLDRSWLVSTMWDDDWRCVGGPAGLVEALLRHPQIEARVVTLHEDATPPGHTAR